jgi:hypothetical protein
MSTRIQSSPFSTYAEFWNFYVREHQHPVNQALHVIGTVGGLVCVAMTICVSRWWGLAILPVGYGTAWLGHVLIERNLPVTLKYPFWSLRADYQMVLTLLRGRQIRSQEAAPDAIDRRAA